MRDPSRQKTTAWRGYGDETPIGKWVRNNEELPSRSSGSAFSVSNTDLTIHGYMQSVDGIGTRSIQSLIRVEFKSFGKIPDTWQLDTLFKEHCGINIRPCGYDVKGATVINHGIYICVCSGSTPEDSEWIKWGRFLATGIPSWRTITTSVLNSLLRFDVHPKTLERWSLRRHHKKTVVHRVARTPLGFEVEQEITVRS